MAWLLTPKIDFDCRSSESAHTDICCSCGAIWGKVGHGQKVTIYQSEETSHHFRSKCLVWREKSRGGPSDSLLKAWRYIYIYTVYIYIYLPCRWINVWGWFLPFTVTSLTRSLVIGFDLCWCSIRFDKPSASGLEGIQAWLNQTQNAGCRDPSRWASHINVLITGSVDHSCSIQAWWTWRRALLQKMQRNLVLVFVGGFDSFRNSFSIWMEHLTQRKSQPKTSTSENWEMLFFLHGSWVADLSYLPKVYWDNLRRILFLALRDQSHTLLFTRDLGLLNDITTFEQGQAAHFASFRILNPLNRWLFCDWC